MRDIDLALSGGGVRAMVFHLGVLKHLSERGLLERVARVSSVSGGTLIAGLILKESAMRWPDSETFARTIFPALREKICSRCMMWGMVRQLKKPRNLRFLIARVHLLGLALQNEWGVSECLNDLPESPEFLLEGTTAQTGKRFQFKRDSIGDYTLGYADGRAYRLAKAMAVSAAFPGGLGPLRLHTGRYCWHKKRNWGKGETGEAVPEFDTLHLYDGGVYDNLGLEPFFSVNANKPRNPERYLIVSDAGKPFQRGFSAVHLNPRRLLRIMDIAMEQCRSLRVRGFHGYLRGNPDGGAYLWIDSEPDGAADLHAFASAFPTTLRKLTYDEFDKLSDFGRRVARESVLTESGAKTTATAADDEALTGF